MEENPKCPECGSLITYPTGSSQMCAECGHEWNPDELAASNAVRDANGNVLQDGDDVVVRWHEPQRRVAPGQTVVFYDLTDTHVLGGGIAT